MMVLQELNNSLIYNGGYMNKIRYKKYYLYNIQKELLIQKQEMKYEKENKNVKKLILKLF